MKKLFIILTVFLLSFVFIGCANTETTTYTSQTTLETTTLEDKEISVSKSLLNLSVNSEYYIDVSLNFELLESESLSFTSSDEDIATVTVLGKVSGIGFGECDITIRYDESTFTTVHVLVSSEYEITIPNKTIYEVGETINTNGASLHIYDQDHNLIEEVEITNAMILNFDNQESGSQIVTFQYNDIVYGFEVYVLNQTQELSLFNDFIILNSEIVVGEKLEFALTKSNVEEFLDVVNVYDYSQISIYAVFETPDEEMMKMYAFWYQGFAENLIETTIISTMNTEGKVFDTDRDYDYYVDLNEVGTAHYRVRYTPESIGDYDVTLIVEVDGKVIQMFDKSFTVEQANDEDYKGIIRVDETNNRHFVFETGSTYIPVGQNVGWYMSTQRKHYDFKSWFEQMGEAGMNYARVWMAPWGYSIFWDDLYNYDSRQDRMFSLDETLEYADENDIYIQLCLLNHGRFSAEVNPMWPNDENQWYISRYGANPYSDIIESSSLFFASEDIKDLFKNQLKYIIARYSYSDTIMSFELFNEVDWIETYNALFGNKWHTDMAEYIKSIDPYQHMITTSQITESFLSSNYQVFHDESIDYVSIHRYGIYNHTTYLPSKQNTCFEVFGKPVIYDEVGYQGWGGLQQYEADPNNISLHQELWAGALGGGGGTGMNWWWESWIDYYDFYDLFTGIAIYTEQMNLQGADYRVVTSEDGDYDILTLSNNNVGYMGYLFNNRTYLYIYDEDFDIDNQNLSVKAGVEFTFSAFELGTYQLRAFDTITGEVIYSEEIPVNISGEFSLEIPSFEEDIAIIFEKIN